MTIDEAIANARKNAEIQRKDSDTCEYKTEYGCKGCTYYSKPCFECAEESEQLAEWLEELKVYQQHEIICHQGYNAGYSKAIDDCIREVEEEEKQHNHIITKTVYFG